MLSSLIFVSKETIYDLLGVLIIIFEISSFNVVVLCTFKKKLPKYCNQLRSVMFD